MRRRGDGGHCPIHRYTATTTVPVLEGEQHLWDLFCPAAFAAQRASGVRATTR